MKKINHDVVLRIGFAIFLIVWGLDRIIRVDAWASDTLMGYFYGEMGLMPIFVIGLGIAQIIIALSFITNRLVKQTSLLLLAMLTVSTFITITPLYTYLIQGGNPVPAIIFIDHFPLLAGAWAIFDHAKQQA